MLCNFLQRFKNGFNSATKKEKRDVVLALFNAKYPDKSIKFLYHYGYCTVLFPFLHDMIGIGQNKRKSKDLFDHTMRALKFASELTTDVGIRIGAFMHDVGKIHGIQNHEYTGANIVYELLPTLGISHRMTARVRLLVLYHLLPDNFQRIKHIEPHHVHKFVKRIGNHKIASDLCFVAMADKMSAQGRNSKYVEPYLVLKDMIDTMQQE